MITPIVDSHCHLDFDVLNDDLPGVLARAENAGVNLMVTISTRIANFARLQAIAEAHDNVFFTVGTHPHNAAEEAEYTAEQIIELTAHPKVIGIGEAGLDFHYDNSPRDLQECGFRIHIDAARQTGLPLVIHTREAEEKTLEIMSDEMGKGAFKPLMHCFSSRSWLAEKCVEMGAYVSFSGILTFNSAKEVKKSAELVPMDRLLVETDAPFLAPVPHRGKPNQPAYVAETVKVLAEIKGVTADEMARITSDNFFRLFEKAPKPAIYEALA